MVETIFLDWALSFGAGLLFGMAGRGESASVGALMRTRAFKWGLAYLHIGIIAISAALYVIEPDWMWMYWVDSAGLPVVVVVLSFLMYEAAFFAGFALASEIERQRRNATWALAGAMFAAITLVEVLTWRRLFHFGSFAEYHAGAAPLGIDLDPFRLEPAMAIVLGPGLLATVAVVVIAVRLWRDDVARFGRPPGRARERLPEKVG